MANVPTPISALSARDGELRALVAHWSGINSGSRNMVGLARMLAELRRTCEARFPGADCGEVELPGTSARALRLVLRPGMRRRVLLNGHYDTVFEHDDPFQTVRNEGADTLVGPGVADMKGGLVVLFAALEAFELCPGAQELGVEVLLTPDEEIGSRSSAAELASAARRCHFGLIFEPARPGGELVRGRMGTGSIRVTVHGRSAHGAQPELGRNAIAALAEYLVGAHRAPESVPGVLLNIGVVRGGGAINIVPDLAEAELHARIGRPEHREQLLRHLEDLAAPIRSRDGYRLDLAAAFDRPPKVPGTAEEIAFGEVDRAARDLGFGGIQWTDSGGGSDGNLLAAAGLPCLDGMGPIGGAMHSDREYIVLNSLVPRAQVAALLLHRLAIGDWSVPTGAASI